MLGMMDAFHPVFNEKSIAVTTPDVVQVLSVEELMRLAPNHDGWIIGDDPATREVLTAGRAGRLRAAVKWGVGIDNVDFSACKDLDILITNTPNMFGEEVADIALGYVAGLARETYLVDRAVRAGGWPKPRGISLSGRTMALVGFGDIGRNVARRALAAGMKIIAYDPEYLPVAEFAHIETAAWPDRISEADFIVLTCALNVHNRHMLDQSVIDGTKQGVRVVNVARGPLIDEAALALGIESGQVHSAALDVFETEPLSSKSPLRDFERCIFGTHNASNTEDAVQRTSLLAIDTLFGFLGIK
jgi:D-3-phosphoglycerate dehydrogenase